MQRHLSDKMSNKKSCPKVKNACKYCREQVTPKNGLQCQGACQKWAHYTCLNYTPGKISDIKAGLIKVMCPCPDCETPQAKEYLINPPYSCSSNKCPANHKGGPPGCVLEVCPKNKGEEKLCTKKPCVDTKRTRMVPIAPPTPSCPPDSVQSGPKSYTKTRQIKKVIPINSLDACEIEDCPNRGSDSSNSDEENSPKAQASMVHVLQEMCGTVGKLSVQIKDLMGKINKMA